MIYTRTYEVHAITLNNHYEGWHIQEWEHKEKLHTYPSSHVIIVVLG